MSMKTCKHSRCAVCKNVNDRKLFRFIYGERAPDIYICENAIYKITNDDGNYFIIESLEAIKKYTRCYSICDPFTARPIFLNAKNFEIVCEERFYKECCKEPEVTLFGSGE